MGFCSPSPKLKKNQITNVWGSKDQKGIERLFKMWRLDWGGYSDVHPQIVGIQIYALLTFKEYLMF